MSLKLRPIVVVMYLLVVRIFAIIIFIAGVGIAWKESDEISHQNFISNTYGFISPRAS